MHTKGKVLRVKSDLDIMGNGEKFGFTLAEFKHEHDAIRGEALWNAADGMSTKEAVRYLEHGPEMVELLGRALKTTNAKYLRKDIETLLAKLEGK